MRLKAKRFPQGSSSGRGSRLRLTILLAAVAAFLLVPVAQAAAANKLKVIIAGAGSGEVTGKGGYGLAGGVPGSFEGTPPIECNGPPATGVCEDEMAVEGPYRLEVLKAIPNPGSRLVGWKLEGPGETFAFGETCSATAEGEYPEFCFPVTEEGNDITVTVTFATANLTLEKLGTGLGTVVSNPAGIYCRLYCGRQGANFAEGEKVTLTANPDTVEGAVFTSWSGCTKTVEGTGAAGRKCTVQIGSKPMTIKAKFTKVQAITANKDSGGNGFGTVSSSPGGIACGPACSSATAVFTEGSTVTLKAAAVASTSKFAGWTVCPGTKEGTNEELCKVVASEAKSATAKFNLIPQFALTVTKSGFGTGTVSSSPAGISCGPTCTTATAAFNENKEVTLKAVAATGSEFGGWSGSGCSGTGTCTVKMEAAKSVEAEFK